MSAVELQREILDRLGAGDDVFAAEAMKEKAAAVAAALAEQAEARPEGTVEERVATLLGVVLPVVEYGGGAAVDVLPRALAHVARQTSLTQTQSSLPFLAGTLVVGRLGWAIAAYALHCRRLDGLTAAWRAALPSRYDDQLSPPLLADSSLRHADVFERHAGKGYADYRGWLERRDLIHERYPLFAAELAEVFAEADFILALRSAAALRWELYSEGFTSATVGRFHARLADARLREQLAQLFDVDGNELNETLAQAYTRLRANQHSWERPPARLFAATDE